MMRFMSLNVRVIQIMSLLYSYSELFRYFLFNTLQILGADDAFYESKRERNTDNVFTLFLLRIISLFSV